VETQLNMIFYHLNL